MFDPRVVSPRTGDPRIRRLLEAYPAIFLACHRQHVQSDETGKYVSERQAAVLDHLDAKRPVSLTRLAEHMGIGRSAMSIMVSRLRRSGYVSRTADASDGRRIGLRLTTAGMKIKEQNTILDLDLARELFSLLRPDEAERALRGIEMLAQSARIMLRRRKRSHD
jgi:DNA-binding MarR family transcriptional regulator